MQEEQLNKVGDTQHNRKKRCQTETTVDVTRRSVMPGATNNVSSMTSLKTSNQQTDLMQPQVVAKKSVAKQRLLENPKIQDEQANRTIGASCVRKKRILSTSDATRRSVYPSSANNVSVTMPSPKTSTHLVDSTPSHNLMKKRQSMGQATLLSRPPQPDGIKKLGLKSNDMDLMLQYNEYLQAIMVKHIMEKKAEERKVAIITQLATIAKESEHDMAELAKHRRREKDIINLTTIQNALDPLIADVNKYSEDESNMTVMDIASRLYAIVKPLDVLQCENVILPDSTKEKEELQAALKKCSAKLELICDLIGSKGEVYKDICDRLNDLIKANSNIQALQKRLEGVLCNLQSLALKDAATTLT